MLDKNIEESLDKVICNLKESYEYKQVKLIKEKMSNNSELLTMIENLKVLQKLYVKSNYKDNDIKVEMDNLIDELNKVPIYVEYLNCLDVINLKYNVLKESLDNYFNNLLN